MFKERLKSVMIAVLFMSLLALTLLNVMYDRGGEAFSPAAPFSPTAISEAARPAVAAVVRDGEMFAACSGDAAAGAVYNRFRTLLGEALASASDRRPITRAAWIAVMEENCVFFEFLDETPVWALAEGISFEASPAVEGINAKSFILSGGGLFISAGNEYFRCEVFMDFAIPEHTESQLSAARFVNGVIVTDRGNEYPEAVLTDRYRDEPYLSELLAAMGFNPNTNYRYTQADGDIVFVDEQRTLHVGPSGRVTYRDGTVYQYGGTDEREALKLCLNSIPSGPAFWGDGQLNFSGMEAKDGVVTAEFNYALNGAAFIGCRSVFTVRGANITEADIQLCPAVFGERSEELIPQRQAALLLSEGSGLELRYSEAEDGIWLPQWHERD